jgi:isopentenyldiphosphate isomerase
MAELVVVVNDEDEVIGTMLKTEAHRNGTPHRIAVTYVENARGEILVQVRMDRSLDHSSAGHVVPGESYREAAERELSEELGITGVDLTPVGHGVSHEEDPADGSVKRHVFDIFRCEAGYGQLQQDEVADVFWADPEDVLLDMKRERSKYAGGFIESLPIYLDRRRSRS